VTQAGPPPDPAERGLTDAPVDPGEIPENEAAAGGTGGTVVAEMKTKHRIGPDLTPLRFPAYRRLFFGSAVTVVGSQLTAVAVQQEIFSLTGSSTWVGVASLVALVPLIIFGLIGGAVADTYDRRKLAIITSAGVGVTAAGLWLQAHLQLHSVALIMALLALQQLFFAVNQPTRSAIIPRIIPIEYVPSANTLNFTLFGFGVLAGPLLAGMLIPLIGLQWLYFFDAVTLLAVLYAVIRLPPIPPLGDRTGRAKVFDGLAFLRTRPLLLMTFVVDIIAMFFGLPRALFPQMAEETFGGPPGGGIQLGLLNAGMAIGVVIGGLTGGWIHRVHRQGVAIVIAILVWGASMTFLGLSTAIWVAVAMLAVGGWADMVSAAYRSTILQVEVDDDMRGRMQGVFTVVVAGGPRLADLAHGLAAGAFGTAAAVTGGGVLVVVLTLVAARLGPSLWRYDTRHRVAGRLRETSSSDPTNRSAQAQSDP